jgi:hypothetical protein
MKVTVTFIPLSSLLFAYALTRSAWRALSNGGIRQRETLYPLKDLRPQQGL